MADVRGSLCRRVCLELGDKGNGVGWTPLHTACLTGHIDCARLLLDRGDEVDKAPDSGETPLHGACYYNQRHVVALLLERGADPTKQNSGGRTPANFAGSDGIADPELADAIELATQDREVAIERLWGMDARRPHDPDSDAESFLSFD